MTGRPLVEIFAEMGVPTEQVRDNVRRVAAELAEQRRKTAEAESMLAAAIRVALDASIRVADVAEDAGLTRARVYQIRDGRR